MTTSDKRFPDTNIDEALQAEPHKFDVNLDIDDELLAELKALECSMGLDNGNVFSFPSPKIKEQRKSIELIGLKNAVYSAILNNKDEFENDEGDDAEEESSRLASSDCDSTLSCSESEEIHETNKRTHDLGHTVREFVKNSEHQAAISKVGQSIAQLFPEATILFADISGFTAWSSIREAGQVFTLLETIFQAFDGIAKHHHVFKVETVGDCYVAVCGLPDPNKDHATVMARFSRDCVDKFHHVIRGLEMKLGPDTGELGIRVGLNSGPVTAGVLRGERARLQLFGDTFNTTARIEKTSLPDHIHLSTITANLLKEAGHEDWLIKREEIVSAKGQGMMNTFWLKHNPVKPPSLRNDDGVLMDKSLHENDTPYESRIQRCVDWNADLLLDVLKKIITHRKAVHGRYGSVSRDERTKLDKMAQSLGRGHLVVDEVANIIELPDFDGLAIAAKPDSIILPSQVVSQCRAFVARLASMYRDNPFHNFEHATHVTMSVHKLLARIVAPTLEEEEMDDDKLEEELIHDHTYGITSDPLTQFAVILSALVHDTDHRGVSNHVMAKEDQELAERYQNKSVAEQNSVDIAWNALMSDEYEAFRSCIFCDKTELYRFRQLLVNSVIATDIFDKEQSALRKNRWAKAFAEDGCSIDSDDSYHTDINRKATIVIEHLIQASDVAHTMQHWLIYQKWNERLFHEMYEAFMHGRTETDPSIGWYKGELWFFDNYVIPLARKLSYCGVFGVSSDEYLNYAKTNRNEWAISGQAIVEKFKDKYRKKFEAKKGEEAK